MYTWVFLALVHLFTTLSLSFRLLSWRGDESNLKFRLRPHRLQDYSRMPVVLNSHTLPLKARQFCLERLLKGAGILWWQVERFVAVERGIEKIRIQQLGVSFLKVLVGGVSDLSLCSEIHSAAEPHDPVDWRKLTVRGHLHTHTHRHRQTHRHTHRRTHTTTKDMYCIWTQNKYQHQQWYNDDVCFTSILTFYLKVVMTW